jgi:hypothetical protein
MLRILLCLHVLLILLSCTSDKVQERDYLTKYCVVVVIDGPRYSETWGDPSFQHIPFLHSYFENLGVVNTTFYNAGITNTTNGHVALTTGFYENNINNSGQELPSYHSYFQDWMKKNPVLTNSAWIVSSKDKLEVLGNCTEGKWKDQHQPRTDCGENGNFTGYRNDSITHAHATKVLVKYKPNLLLINLKDPDYYGHVNNWSAYLNSIKKSDEYVFKLWNTIQQDPEMAGKTTLFVTNDHGRHTSNFQHHGDDCQGCRHIMFYAMGPDFKKNVKLSVNRSLIDIHATISELMNLSNYSQGNIMTELFK